MLYYIDELDSRYYCIVDEGYVLREADCGC